MFRPLLDAVCASLVISIFVGAEATTITPSEYLSLADGNSRSYSIDGAASTLTLTVVRSATLIIIPRR
jgi:hypothetical protein